MSVNASRFRDVLLPALAAVEGQFRGRIEADLEIDKEGDLWLKLSLLGLPRTYGIRTQLASSEELTSGVFKNTFMTKCVTAFDVFDKAAKIRWESPISEDVCKATMMEMEIATMMEMEIAPEMIEAGVEEFLAYRASLSSPPEEAVVEIFKAMVDAFAITCGSVTTK